MEQKNNLRILGKLSLLLVVLSVIFLKFQHPSVKAQVKEQAVQAWGCLKSNFLFDNSLPPASVDLTLQGTGTANATTYAVLCTTAVYQNSDTMTLGNGSVCTTGYPDEDIRLFGENHISAFSPAIWKSKQGTSKMSMLKDKSLSLSGTLYSPQGHKAYGFFSVAQYIPQPTASLKNKKSLQLGVFEIPRPVPAETSSSCTEMRYDPYGAIFDSQSLEPLPDVQITLRDDNYIPVSLPGLSNPSKPTGADGAFNFLVPPDIYYLDPIIPQGYNFTKTPKINPDWSQIYVNIYHPGDLVDERNGPVRKDIPLDPGINKPYSSDPVFFEDSSVRLGLNTKFKGYVSHPLSDVSIVGKTSGKEYGKTTSDKSGYWEIFTKNSSIPQDEQIVPRATKASIYGINQASSGKNDPLFSKLFSVWAQSVSFPNATSSYSPILTYIEGFAYDRNTILPDTTVYVKLNGSQKGVYYQTKTDSKGFFSIPSQYLPIFPYHLEYEVSPNNPPIYVTTDQFALENKTFLDSNNINLATKQASEAVDLSARKDLVIPKSSSVEVSSSSQSVSDEKQLNLNKKSGPFLFIIILSVIFILGIVLIGIIYFRTVKRNSDPELLQPPDNLS